MIPIVYPYSLDSQTAKDIANALNTKRVKPDGNYIYRDEHLVINYGNSRRPNWDRGGVLVINHWDSVANAVNKLKTLQILKQNNIAIVEFSTNIEDAKHWISEGKIAFCRQTLTGHSGEGIIVADTIEKLVDAPLYTKYANYKNEYRLHFMGGKLIDYAQKKKSIEAEEANEYIRSYSKNWKFCREGVYLPKVVVDESRKAVKALGLDFAAIDVRFKVKDNICAILEVNTSPALQNTTFENYLNGFKKLLNNEELTDIDYGNYTPEIRQAAPVAQVAPVQESINNNEEILYHFPSISSLKVIKSGNEHILKFIVNGREQQIVI